jgi:hypothetical protein
MRSSATRLTPERLVPLRAAACAIRDIVPDDRREGCLTLPLVLSSWLRLHRLDLDDACDALVELRHGVVATAGLDAASEPVPLVVGDRRRAVVSLATYLDGLVERAAWAGGTDREAVLESALAALVP